MGNTHPDTDRNGEESPSPAVAALIVLGLVALGLGPMALGSLLPSWVVLGLIAAWAVYRVLRGDR
jgi:hypothetical protein